MNDEATIVEVSLFSGRILVTFSDGLMAFLESRHIYHLAVEARALMPLPVADMRR